MIARLTLLALVLFSSAPIASAATYEVGPGKPYATPSAVPWESLQPGDPVLIHWRAHAVHGQVGDLPPGHRGRADHRSAACRTRPASCRSSTATARRRAWRSTTGARRARDQDRRRQHPGRHDAALHRRSRTSTSAARARPTRSPTTAAASAVLRGQRRGDLHREGRAHHRSATTSCTTRATACSSARPSRTSRATSWSRATPSTTTATSAASSSTTTTPRRSASSFSSTASGRRRRARGGNNLKDRSAGLVVRYNWIEGGNRQLDLVETDSATIQNDPAYRKTFVYGNVLVETDGAGNRQIVHYGGDNGTTSNYRKGTLHFYQNTLVSYAHRSDDAVPAVDQRRARRRAQQRLLRHGRRLDAVARSTRPASSTSRTTGSSRAASRHSARSPGTINDDGTSVVGSAPGFRDEPAQDFRLAQTSIAVNKGTALAAAALPDHACSFQYVKHQGSQRGPMTACSISAPSRWKTASRRSRRDHGEPAGGTRGSAIRRCLGRRRRGAVLLEPWRRLCRPGCRSTLPGGIAGTPDDPEQRHSPCWSRRAGAGRHRDEGPVADLAAGAAPTR